MANLGYRSTSNGRFGANRGKGGDHLVAIRDDTIVASVPDLITILDAELGDAITTEHLRYGYRVVVVGIRCDPKWRTPAGSALGRHCNRDLR